MDSKTVLIVDDDDNFRDNIIDILEDEGYTVYAANRCDEAIRITSQFAPDVIFLDIKLPDGSGTELLKELKKLKEDSVYIMMTAFADLKSALTALEHGASQYLQKPIQPRELLYTLERIFDTICLRRENLLTEEKLRESERTVRSFLDAYPYSALLIDASGKIISVNKPALEFMEKERNEVVGCSIWAFGLPEHTAKRQEVIREVADSKKTILFEETIKGQFFETSVSPVFDSAGNLSRFAVFSSDITEMKQMEEERRKLEAIISHSQRMEAVGTLTGGIAHDFNNLLQSILGYTQILLLDTDSGSSQFQKLNEIQRAARMAGDLTSQLLTFSRKVEIRSRPMSLNQTIKQVENLLKHTISKMIEIETILDKDLWVINADPGQIEQILVNLAVNARDAMPEGGKLIIATGNVVLDNEFCKVVPILLPGEYAMMRIVDTGCGIEGEILDHIFEPFFTTKEVGKGSGLGLAMVFGIVQAHKGYVACESQVGKGTTFTIYLPAVSSDFVDESDNKKDETLTGGSECILIVDDEESLRSLAAETLEYFGYKTITAPDGETAIELYKQKREQIALVIMDLIMPGMGGKHCLEEMLRIDPKVKVLIASGYLNDEEINVLTKAGAKGFIIKPYQMEELLKTIREHLDAKANANHKAKSSPS